jgi:hypothetical protein
MPKWLRRFIDMWWYPRNEKRDQELIQQAHITFVDAPPIIDWRRQPYQDWVK